MKRTTMGLLLIFYIVATLVFTSCSFSTSYSTNKTADTASSPTTNQSPTQTFVVPNTYTTYQDENNFFSISYPEQWEPDPNLANVNAQMTQDISNLKQDLSIANTDILFIAGLRTSTGYLPNINVLVESAPAGIVNDDLAADAAEQGMKGLYGYQMVSMTKTTIDGKDAVIIESKCYASSTTNILYHDLTLVQLSGNNIWDVTCTAHDDTYSQLSNDFNNVIRSFKLTK
jgi:PsbP-like protein